MGLSPSLVRGKRVSGTPRYFLTGGTGFLGSHIAAELLRRGRSVSLLARSNGHGAAADRVRELLDWFGLTASERRGLRVFEGDITRPALGLDPSTYGEALQTTDEIIHCASNTAFVERKRAEVEATNVAGLGRVLAFARASEARFFHHVSTAFVAGMTSGLCPEEPAKPGGFHNVYEETKCLGERAVAAACRGAGIRLSIYRPSIVYGDSRTGRSLVFNAVYFPVRTAFFLRDVFERDIREKGGRRAADMGISLEADGVMRLPLRIPVSGAGGLDLIPVDYFLEAFLALMDGARQGGIFHIVSGTPERIEAIIDYSSRLFRLTGIRAASPEDFARSPKTPLEALYGQCVEAYEPYMKDERVFDTTRARAVLDRVGLKCPRFDFAVFERCMKYAVEAGWGSRLFARGAPEAIMGKT